MRGRGALIVVVTGALLLGAAQSGGPPDYPVKFINVNELKAQLDRGVKIDVIDVRDPDAYADLHVKKARNIPISQVERRAPKEISKTGRVVFY
jgi:hypothetical protein